MGFCSDSVNKWLPKVRCVSGTFNEQGGPCWQGDSTISIPYCSTVVWCDSEFNSAKVSGDELNIRIVLIVCPNLR